jgi:Rrf2 family protein
MLNASLKGFLMISRTAEYALRAVVFLAGFPDTPMTTQEIANKTKVPQGYLAKVLQALSRADIVISQRGLRGGYTLAKPSEDILVLDVINGVDPIEHIRTCPLKLKSHGVNLCPLHQRLENSINLIEEQFSQSTIADLINEQTTSKPLCDELVTIDGIDI